MNKINVLLAFVLCLVFVAGQTGSLGVPTFYPSQPLISYQLPASATSGQIAFVDFVGDLTGDGFSEVAAGTWNGAYLVDIASGILIYRFSGIGPVAGLGDINGDFVPDFAVANIGSITVYSGIAGNPVISTITDPTPHNPPDAFPQDMARFKDINNDGRDEILVSEFVGSGPGTPTPNAYIFDALNGALLIMFTSPTSVAGSAVSQFGNAVSDIGDVDSDGVHDAAVSGGVPYVSGFVSVFSGSTGALLYTIAPSSSIRGLGSNPRSISSAGDFNFDSVPDFTVSEFSMLISNAPHQVMVYSGNTGTALTTVTYPTASDPQRVAGGNINGDFYGDFVSGGLSNKAYNGPNAQLLFDWNRPGYNPVFAVGDYDGDLIDEVLVGTTSNNPIQFNLFAEKLIGVKSYGLGTITLTWVPTTGIPSLGAFLIAGLFPLEQDVCLAASGSPWDAILNSGNRVYVNVNDPAFRIICGLQADNTGSIYIPNIGLIAGTNSYQKVYIQAAVSRSGSIYTSNGEEATIRI